MHGGGSSKKENSTYASMAASKLNACAQTSRAAQQCAAGMRLAACTRISSHFLPVSVVVESEYGQDLPSSIVRSDFQFCGAFEATFQKNITLSWGLHLDWLTESANSFLLGAYTHQPRHAKHSIDMFACPMPEKSPNSASP